MVVVDPFVHGFYLKPLHAKIIHHIPTRRRNVKKNTTYPSI